MTSDHPDARIAAAVKERRIVQVVHFTTSHGLLGILASTALQARATLGADNYLEHIYRPNSNIRKEQPKYWEYVNLSIGQVNTRFFQISQSWHATREGLFWAILHLDPDVLAHPGVLFSPGNMAYEGMTPQDGIEGFEKLFAPLAPYGFGKHTRRRPELPPNQPTEPQAEVLYPHRIETRWLRAITVATHEDAAEVEGIVGTVDHPEVQVLVDPTWFRR